MQSNCRPGMTKRRSCRRRMCTVGVVMAREPARERRIPTTSRPAAATR
jgi:hypothetical protein